MRLVIWDAIVLIMTSLYWTTKRQSKTNRCVRFMGSLCPVRCHNNTFTLGLSLETISVTAHECHGISTHWKLDCLLKRTCWYRNKMKIKAPHYWLLCEGIPPGTSEISLTKGKKIKSGFVPWRNDEPLKHQCISLMMKWNMQIISCFRIIVQSQWMTSNMLA